MGRTNSHSMVAAMSGSHGSRRYLESFLSSFKSALHATTRIFGGSSFSLFSSTSSPSVQPLYFPKTFAHRLPEGGLGCLLCASRPSRLSLACASWRACRRSDGSWPALVRLPPCISFFYFRIQTPSIAWNPMQKNCSPVSLTERALSPPLG